MALYIYFMDMKSSLNQKIISIINNYFTNNVKTVQYLSDLLNLSRESVYRRLKNEIPFSFHEIVIIASEIGISIDEIVGYESKDRAFFDFKIFDPSAPVDRYSEMMNKIIEMFYKISNSESSDIVLTMNRLPIALYMQSENLSKFHYYKWIHQTQDIPFKTSFSEYIVPSEINSIQKKYKYVYNTIISSTIVFDNNLFRSVTNSISYYYKCNLINKEELILLKDELHQAIDMMESITKNKMIDYDSQKPYSDISLYLSSLDIESNSLYFNSGMEECTYYWIHSLYPIYVYNKEICKKQKNWINSLLKYSTLISKCNENIRFNFFDRQRNYINKVGE